jgi:hypothetical protein
LTEAAVGALGQKQTEEGKGVQNKEGRVEEWKKRIEG